ncbi:MAG: molybdenum cofactor guanylyltransferase [Actinomycetota bacterium]
MHGLLLTGGRSSRMGGDKALMTVGGVDLAERVATALLGIADPVWVAGPLPIHGLEAVADPGRGPLVALVAAWQRLTAQGHKGSVLLAACDLPFVTSEFFGFLVDNLGDADAVCPVADGRDQPLAACYAPAALRQAQHLLEEGEDSMRSLLAAIRVRRIPESEWQVVAPAVALMDVDTPEELAAARRIAARERTI